MADPREGVEPRQGADPHDVIVVVDLAAVTRPDVATIEALARLQLAARRHRCRLQLRGASPALAELLTFTGLCDGVEQRPT